VKHKALALVSGGLDSLLAARLVMDQGIEVQGIAFVMQFASKDIARFKKNVRFSSEKAGIPVKFVDISDQFLDLIKDPDHGYGAHVNPCIDCKILMIKNAARSMREEGAGFIVTGEVLGERPMSQRRAALDIISRKSGLKGLILRPLSARLLDPTIPEEKGVIDRDGLLDISGRSRTPQLELADKFGIKDFFTPAGGCLLTDPIFSVKLKELMSRGDFSKENAELLKYGRHFRLPEGVKMIVGRNKNENVMLRQLKKKEDVLIRMKDHPGPYVLLRGHDIHQRDIRRAGAAACAYSKQKDADSVKIEYIEDPRGREVFGVSPLPRSHIEKWKIREKEAKSDKG
jgi:tRNA U34 2-thiouridine synthase MnmA/TrmU